MITREACPQCGSNWFKGKKANRRWIWIAMDAATRQVIAFHVGDRGSQSACALWQKLPAVYQE